MNLLRFTNCSQLSIVTTEQVCELLLAANAETAAYGLILTPQEAREVAAARSMALIENGRIDFSGEIPTRIARLFCDSPYLTQTNYAAQLMELVALFYEARGETEDKLSDAALMQKMRNWFDDPAQGEITLLRDLLWGFARRLEMGDSLHEVDEGEPDARAWAMDGLDTREYYTELF